MASLRYAKAPGAYRNLEKTIVNEFGSDWPRQKLLCYNVRAAVINTLGCLELIEEKPDKSVEKKP
jgi:hypothetical protein